MKIKSHILTLLSCLIATLAFTQNIEFIENKGQWDNRVRFMGEVSNGAFFIHNDGFTVLQHKAGDLEKLHTAMHERKRADEGGITVHSHSYKVSFVNANEKARIEADKQIITYNNYFIGSDPSKWASNCKIYQGITIRDIYPNIDIRYYSDRGVLKYDLIVRPGGNVSDIALKYDGVDKLDIKNKELLIGTSIGELKELSPYTYQYNEKGKTEVSAKYSVRENVVRFDIKDYDSKTTLIIDPTLEFCSFSGSTADNWGFSATYGPDGSMFGGGIVFAAGFPVSPGAFQTNFGTGTGCLNASGFDMGIIKLSPDGSNRLYATYLGGSGSEMPQSLICDPQGNLIIAGRTNSPTSPSGGAYPVSSSGQIGLLGSWDIVLTKLNVTGSNIIGSIRIGGTGDDGANINPCTEPNVLSLQQNYGDEGRSEVNIDGVGNIYLASSSMSNNFPITGGFQSTLGGKQDGVVLKFNSNLSVLNFSSYFGGTENDAAYSIAIASNGTIYVAGGTESFNLPGSTAGTIGSTNHGSIDGFVTSITSNGSAIIKTTYLGTGGIDQVYGIQFDKLDFPYVMGQTTGAFPVTPSGVWSTPNGRQFIAKLQPNLSSFVYSTVFGKTSGGSGAPDISPVAFLVDRCENVYVSGWGGQKVGSYATAGVQGLPVTPDAIKSAPDIDPATGLGRDFYFFVLKKNATSQLYGSFYGQNGGLFGDHVDGGTSRFDKDGVIYQAICASCGSAGSLPFTTPGAWSVTKPPSANCNLAMVKISFNFAGVKAGVQSIINGQVRDTAGCVPLTVNFVDTVASAVSYEWNFGDAPTVFTSTSPSFNHTFTAIGTYQVMLVAIDSSTCNIRDTSYLRINVGDLRAQLNFDAIKLNPCDSFKYRFDNTSVPPATLPFGAQTFTWSFGDGSPNITTGNGSVFHTYASAGTYNVRLILRDSNYCNYPDTLTKQIRVAALVNADFDTPPNGCAPYNAQFTNTSQAGAQFIWNFGDASAPSTNVSPSHLYSIPGTYTVTLIAIDSGTCNVTDTVSFSITVYVNPVADFSAAPQPPTVNTPISFTNLSSPDAIKFKWLFGDGDSLNTTSRAVIQHDYNKTATYTTCLIAFNQAGCSDTLCRPVQTLINAAVDVPSAFTPLKGGVNGIVYVRGFGIAKMKFTVYARWGEKVFESSSKNAGWNGYYKGKLLPMDVYAYTLDVEFSDGTKTTKTGDITLIR